MKIRKNHYAFIIKMLYFCDYLIIYKLITMNQRINATIDLRSAQQLGQNFDNYLKSLSGNPNINYANCAWFDIGDLELYIAGVKEAANNSGQKFSGIRIYFGKYNQTSAYDDLTVFLSPTVAADLNAQGSGEDKDMNYDAENFGVLGNPPKKVYPYN